MKRHMLWVCIVFSPQRQFKCAQTTRILLEKGKLICKKHMPSTTCQAVNQYNDTVVTRLEFSHVVIHSVKYINFVYLLLLVMECER